MYMLTDVHVQQKTQIHPPVLRTYTHPTPTNEQRTWKTVTSDQSSESKFFLSRRHVTDELLMSAHEHASPVSMLVLNLPPNKCMPSTLKHAISHL